MTDCPTPGPCELQTFTVNASSTYPRSAVSWEIDLPMQEHMYYQNVTYGLITTLMSRIGVEFSKFGMDGDAARFSASVDEIKKSLDANITG